MSKSLFFLGIIFFVAGVMFLFLSHDVHLQLTFGKNLSHLVHTLIGAVVGVLGLAIISHSGYQPSLGFLSKRWGLVKKVLVLLFFSVILVSVFFETTEGSHEQEGGNEEPEEGDHRTFGNSDYARLHAVAQAQMGAVGDVTEFSGIDPSVYLTTWNFNNLPLEERSRFYKETSHADGSLLREYWFYAEEREIEIAPGVFFPAWAYNGQVPGPTIRATEGDRVRVYFTNKAEKPHTMHFHGFHPAGMDGSHPDQLVLPGETFVYEFTAEPFGTHLYHCHSVPLAQHIAKGLYGVYIVDPKVDVRPKPNKELIMLMNGFDPNFDEENEVYAVNTVAFYYMKHPIKVKQGELVRIHLSNMLEIDQINSFHLHGNFFDKYNTGTTLVPSDYTDVLILGQGERSILDVRFKFPGQYMFHAHKTEFADKGWMGMFEVEE